MENLTVSTSDPTTAEATSPYTPALQSSLGRTTDPDAEWRPEGEADGLGKKQNSVARHLAKIGKQQILNRPLKQV